MEAEFDSDQGDELDLIDLETDNVVMRTHDAAEDEAFILDLGSDTIKYGWSSDAAPRKIKNSNPSQGLFCHFLNSSASTRLSHSCVVVEATSGLDMPVDAANPDYVQDNGSGSLMALIKYVLKVGDYRPSQPLMIISRY